MRRNPTTVYTYGHTRPCGGDGDLSGGRDGDRGRECYGDVSSGRDGHGDRPWAAAVTATDPAGTAESGPPGHLYGPTSGDAEAWRCGAWCTRRRATATAHNHAATNRGRRAELAAYCSPAPRSYVLRYVSTAYERQHTGQPSVLPGSEMWVIHQATLTPTAYGSPPSLKPVALETVDQEPELNWKRET